MKRLETTLLFIALTLAPTSASAELWNALDTVPKPNAIIGYDTSVTMRIDVGCNSCHRSGLPRHRERSFIARQDILATMPLFQDYFIFGGFEYQGCGSARIRARTTPRVGDPLGSYNATRTLLNNARGCNRSERNYPAGSRTRCITPTTLCMGDPPVAEAILRGGLTGLNIPPVPAATSTVCGNPARVSPTFDLQGFLLSQTGGMQWPRWDAHITRRHVEEEFCSPLFSVIQATRTALNRCLLDPNAYWDLSSVTGPTGAWCDPAAISANACTTSPLVGTCVCDQSHAQCFNTAGLPRSPCGQPLTWKARQQIAVCETYNAATFGATFASQSDNRVNTGGCRENVAMFFTDGYQGHRPGVEAEAQQAQFTYGSASGQPNMFVFRIANSFRGEANRMMRYVSNGQLSEAFSATDDAQMRTSFSQVLARIYRGDYGGTSLALSPYGDRVAVSSFVVPGYTAGAPVSDTYIGWPMRIAFHAVDAAGGIDPNPLFQTDWASRVSGGSSCQSGTIGGELTRLLGPGGSFDNGVSRTVTIPTGALGDRDSDGDMDPSQPLRWGRFFGFGATRPVIVEAPNESPDPAWGTAWFDHVNARQHRPRAIYAMGGGYVLGFHGGTHAGSGTFAGQNISHTYADNTGEAGVELFRYRPSWMASGAQGGRTLGYDLSLNPLVPQRLTTGQMVAREVYLRLGGREEFRTILVGAQGKEGGGYFVLDISDPCAPAVMAEWELPPNTYASAKPEVYYFPESGAPEQRAAVVTTGGLGGDPLIIAYDVRNGNELSRRQLPAPGSTSYPSAPVCVDVSGEGAITHCYAVRSDGYLARVEIDPTGLGFVDDVDLTPTDASPHPNPIDGSRVYSTEPAVYFGPDGAVNIVYGSGSHRDLTVPGPRNYVYKVIDDGSRQNGVPDVGGRVQDACVASGTDTQGVFPLPAGDRLVSAPVVADGVVAWTSYHTASSGCISGSAGLYAMRYDSCEDALGNNTDRPQEVPIGDGIPTSPILHRQSGTLMTRTSAGSRAEGVGAYSAETSGRGQPWARKLYWRYELDVR